MRVKKSFLIWSIVLSAVILGAAILLATVQNRVIGTINGTENEMITIDGVTYRQTNTEHPISDRGIFLGKVTNGSLDYTVYSVYGDDSKTYIFTVNGFDTGVFERS